MMMEHCHDSEDMAVPEEVHSGEERVSCGSVKQEPDHHQHMMMMMVNHDASRDLARSIKMEEVGDNKKVAMNYDYGAKSLLASPIKKEEPGLDRMMMIHYHDASTNLAHPVNKEEPGIKDMMVHHHDDSKANSPLAVKKEEPEHDNKRMEEDHDDSKENSRPRKLKASADMRHLMGVHRQREADWKEAGVCKPDMKAFKELRKRGLVPERKYGEMPGVPVGIFFKSRGEAAVLGIHRQILKGIDSVKGESCYAVCCLEGAYADDEEELPDGTIWYTGEGGRDQNSKLHTEDQTETSANASLIESYCARQPIRVLVGKHQEYHYKGLYRCEDYTIQPGVDGFIVFKFKLMPAVGAARSFPRRPRKQIERFPSVRRGIAAKTVTKTAPPPAKRTPAKLKGTERSRIAKVMNKPMPKPRRKL